MEQQNLNVDEGYLSTFGLSPVSLSLINGNPEVTLAKKVKSIVFQIKRRKNIQKNKININFSVNAGGRSGATVTTIDYGSKKSSHKKANRKNNKDVEELQQNDGKSFQFSQNPGIPKKQKQKQPVQLENIQDQDQLANLNNEPAFPNKIFKQQKLEKTKQSKKQQDQHDVIKELISTDSVTQQTDKKQQQEAKNMLNKHFKIIKKKSGTTIISLNYNERKRVEYQIQRKENFGSLQQKLKKNVKKHEKIQLPVIEESKEQKIPSKGKLQVQWRDSKQIHNSKLLPKNKKLSLYFGAQRHEYKISPGSKEIAVDNWILHDCEIVSKRQQFVKEGNRSVRKVFYCEFQKLSNCLQSLIQYEIAKNSYEGHLEENFSGCGLGKESKQVNVQRRRFLNIFEYWGENCEGKFVVYIIQERLPLLKSHLDSLLITYADDFNTLQKKLKAIILFIVRTYAWVLQDAKLRTFIDNGISNIYYRGKQDQEDQSKFKAYKAHGGKNKFDLGDVRCSEIPVFCNRTQNVFDFSKKDAAMKEITRENALAHTLKHFYNYVCSKLNSSTERIIQIRKIIEKELNKNYKDKYGNKYNLYQLNLKTLKTILEQPTPNLNFVVKNKFLFYKSQCNQKTLLGSGAYGAVYSVISKNNICYALKVQTVQDCQSFSLFYKEIAFNLMIPESLPLIKLKEIFVAYDEESQEYSLSILMEKGTTDLSGQIKNYKKDNKLFSFEDFYPVFKFPIIGLVYLHSNGIAHRDIKPQNLMRMENGFWVLVDYGVGTNLQNKIQNANIEDQYQIDRFGVAGSLNYLDPILKEQYIEIGLDSEADYNYKELDIYKADIYSLGLTFIQCLIGINISEMNSVTGMFDVISKALYQTQLPIQIIQLILHMVTFVKENRIPSYALYQSLKSISAMLENQIQLSVFPEKYWKVLNLGLTKSQDWFEKDWLSGEKKYVHFKYLTWIDQTFYNGYWQIQYPSHNDNLQNVKNLKANTIILSKPHYLPGIFLSLSKKNNKECSILSEGQKLNILIADVIVVKLPIFKIGSSVEFLEQKSGKWEICDITDIDQQNHTYTIRRISTQNRPQLKLIFNTILLRSIPQQSKTKLFYDSLDYKITQIFKDEIPLFTNYNFFNPNQLLELDLNLSTQEYDEILKIYTEFIQKYKYTPRLNVYGGNGNEFVRKLEKFVMEKPDLILSHIKNFNFANVNFLSADKINLWTLHDLDLSYECRFKNHKQFGLFLVKLKQEGQSLTRFSLDDLRIQRDAPTPLNQEFMEIIANSPLQHLKLNFARSKSSRIEITLSVLNSLFTSIQKRKFCFLKLTFCPDIASNTDKTKLQALGNLVFDTIKQQTLIQHLMLRLFHQYNAKTVSFDAYKAFPAFIKENKARLAVLKSLKIKLSFANKNGLDKMAGDINVILNAKNAQLKCLKGDISLEISKK